MYVLNVVGTDLLKQFLDKACVATGSAYFGVAQPKDRDFICSKTDYVKLWTELSRKDGVCREENDPTTARSGSESTYFRPLPTDDLSPALPVNLIVLPDASTVRQWVMATNLMKSLFDQGALQTVLGERSTRVALFKQLLSLVGAAQQQNSYMVELFEYRTKYPHDKELLRSDRVFVCPSCLLVRDRDLNAAMNLEQTTTGGRRDVKPADQHKPAHLVVSRAGLKQEFHRAHNRAQRK